jgi:hypothetical protein
LFSILLNKRNYSEEQLMAYALGISGFLTEKYQKKWQHSEKFQLYKNSWDNFAYEEQNITINFNISNVRPLNHPIRRMVFLTKMILDPTITSLETKFKELWLQNWCKLSLTKLYMQMMIIFPQYQSDYWNAHYNFENTETRQVLPLLGESLKKEILLNVILPVLQQDIIIRNDVKELQTFRRFLSGIPSSPSNKLRYLSYRFLGEANSPKLINKICVQQGMYQVHSDFCQYFEVSCEGCSFSDRFSKYTITKEGSTL